MGLLKKRVMNRQSHSIGTIVDVSDSVITVSFHGMNCRYGYPECFDTILELEDEEEQAEWEKQGSNANFEQFKKMYGLSIFQEIQYLKESGGKKYRVIDGEKIGNQNNDYLYAFDTDTELHLPDGTPIKIWLPENIIPAYIVSCEEYTVLIRSNEYLGEKIETIEFSAEQWALLEALKERLAEMTPSSNSIAYQLACKGKSFVDYHSGIMLGQSYAMKKASRDDITFVWGPPGTGKTTTLAKIALEAIDRKERVLMLSYSNVSVDGALLKVANMSDREAGSIIRYGYPRTKELIDNGTLTSYQFVLSKNPELNQEYRELNKKKRGMKRKDPERIPINNRLNRIRDLLLEQEKELIQNIQDVDERFYGITTATVHQFQGSEKPIVIYDVVDCFRQKYPGNLLTSAKNNTANRLFNVALTRAQGKFILVTNRDYLVRKKISKNLLFTKTFQKVCNDNAMISGDQIISEMSPINDEVPHILVGDRDELWNQYLEDLKNAKKQICMEIPGQIEDDKVKLEQLSLLIDELTKREVEINIRVADEVDIPEKLSRYIRRYSYVTTPVTVIDKTVIWYGQPMSEADFFTEGETLFTEYFPTIRFKGKYTARALQAFLELAK